MNKTLLALVIIILVGGGAYFLFAKNAEAPVATTTSDDARMMGSTTNPTATSTSPVGKLKVANFTGTLQQVNTGCYADGECFVVVDGKHITVIMGRSQEVSGKVLDKDAESNIGDLEKHIGEQVEVYVKDMGNGTYSLYGSEGFYVKLI